MRRQLLPIVVMLLALVMVALAASAEEKRLSPLLEAKRDVVRLRIENDELRQRNDALEAQAAALQGVVNGLLRSRAQASTEALQRELGPVERELVAALGGDYAKGDRYDFKAGRLTQSPREEKQ